MNATCLGEETEGAEHLVMTLRNMRANGVRSLLFSRHAWDYKYMMSKRPKPQRERSEPAPLGFIIVIFVTGILLAVFFALLSAAFLIAMPVVVPLGAAVIIAALVWVYFWPWS